MIKAITDLSELEIALRSTIMTQAELDGKYVLNALQLKGPVMHKNVGITGEMIFKSFVPADSVIIFELIENDDGHNMSEEITVDGSVKQFVFAQYALKLIIYGNNSGLLAQKLKARMLTNEVRDTLFDAGIHLQTISKIESASEFINDMLWQRRDMTIEIACQFEIANLNSYDDFRIISKIEVDVQ